MRTLKREEIYANSYRDLDDLRARIGEFIDNYYNGQRMHSALGYRSPEEFEQALEADSATVEAGPRLSCFQVSGDLSIRCGEATNGKAAVRRQPPGASYR